MSRYIKQLDQFLTDRYPLYYAEPWDSVGLCMGDMNQRIAVLLGCVTLTPEVFCEAQSKNVDLLLCHHPFPFREPENLSVTERELYENLQRESRAVYSLHTAFDNAPRGINDQCLDRALSSNQDHVIRTTFLRLDKVIYGDHRTQKDISSFEPMVIGSGRVAELSTQVAIEDLAQRLAQSLEVSSLRMVLSSSRATRVASVCGVASDFVDDALRAQVDLLICGELRYHDCLKLKAGGCSVILLSHFLSERFAMEALVAECATYFGPSVSVMMSSADQCPVSQLNLN